MGDIIGYIIDTIISFFIGAWFSRFWFRNPFRRPPATGKTSLIGKTGEIKSKLKNNYYEIAVDSQIWRAVPDDPNETFAKGEIAYVKSVRDLTLYISKIK
jgi:membrane protein implicated in regulation of membrane protease activity